MKIINNPAWFNQNTALLILRVGVGAAFLAHGLGKLGGMEGTIAFFTSLGLPVFMAWAVALIETLGGAALILGVFTRVAGLLLAAVMVGAFFSVKMGKPFMGGWELEFILFIVTLALAASGPGRYAVKKRVSTQAPVL